MTPTLNGSLPVFTYIPFSSGLFYLYINYPDKYADQSGRDDHSFVAIENYCMVNVDSHTFRLDGENDYNMECESRKYCVFSESCVDSWEDCPGHVMQMLQLNVQMVHVSQISRIVHVLRNFHMPVCLFSDVTDRL